MSLNFAPGESNIYEDSFMPSLVLFFLKAKLGVSSTRFVLNEPNTILGIVPLGSRDEAVPLGNIASVGVNTRYRVFRLFFGFIFLIAGLTSLGDSFVGGLFMFLLGGLLLATGIQATLLLKTNSGSEMTTSVSILEKTKLEKFREEVNQRIFADSGALRHEEHVKNQEEQMRHQQTQIQSQIVTNQLLSAQNQQPAPPPAPGAPEPAQYQVGDIVNGHRFNGASWEPVDNPADDSTTEM